MIKGMCETEYNLNNFLKVLEHQKELTNNSIKEIQKRTCE